LPGAEATQRVLLLKEIAGIVTDAQRNRTILKAGPHDAKLFASYPGAHFSLGRIIDELIHAASTAKVPVEISRPHPEST
jgi:hypothetical protein